MNLFVIPDLEKQYQLWRNLYYIDLGLALILILFGSTTFALGTLIIALLAGAISNHKLVLMNQELVLGKLTSLEATLRGYSNRK